MPTFTPPTVAQGSTDPFFGRYSIQVGQSVVRSDGTFQTIAYPWIGELQAAGSEGTDWFLGGRTYVITDAIGTELTAAGYTVIPDPPGFGEDGFGDGPYGSDGYGN